MNGEPGAVVVPTFGRDELLARCVESLSRLDPAPVAVIVIDGNAQPVRLPREHPPNLVVVREANRGPGHARNTGFAAAIDAGATIVCFLDDDAVADPRWFGAHLAAHAARPRAGVVGGRVDNARPDSAIAEFVHASLFDLGPCPRRVRTVPTVNVSYKRACLDEVGEFDATLRTNEDVELHARIADAGWEVWFDPTPAVTHQYVTTWRGLVRQQLAYGRGFSQLRHRRPDLPGADLLAKPWPVALAGTVPHVARDSARLARAHGARVAPAAAVGTLAYRAGALRERRRLERGDAPGVVQ